MHIVLQVRDERHRLLFEYDPLNEVIWIKHKNSPCVKVSLLAVKALNADKINDVLSTSESTSSE